MAGKTVTTKPTEERVKPGPKPGAKAAAAKPAAKAAAAKPAGKAGAALATPAGIADATNATDLPKTKAKVEPTAARKVFLESMAHALIFDIFQMTPVLQAISRTDEGELEYFLDNYANSLRPLLIEDQRTGNIDGLLDLGVWNALEGQEEVLTEAILFRLGGALSATPQQLKLLSIEAAFGQRRDQRPSRGEGWLPGRRSGFREALVRDTQERRS
jgi:hypothetical protein